MIVSGNTDISKVYYSGYTISKIYACGGELVWSGDTPTPPEPTNLKYKGDYNTGQSKEVECNGMASLTVAEVQNETPSSMSNLSSATIYSCAEYISNDILAAAVNIKWVNIKEGVISVGGGILQSTNVETVIIPNSVTSIGSYAFGDCTHLTGLTIGSGITEIATGSFSGCTSITNNIQLPNIETIGGSAFRGCNHLNSVTIGASITSIGGGAFRDCTRLQSVVCLATTPPSCAPYAFENTTCPIYVPSESVEAYKTKYAWNSYADRIQAIP